MVATSPNSAAPLPQARQPTDPVSLARRLTDIAIELSTERNLDLLLEKILLEAKAIANADGGTLYYCTDKDTLEFAIIRTDSLGIAYGGSTGREPPLKPIRLYDSKTGQPNFATQSVFAVLKKKPINIDDVYASDVFDFAGTRRFDSEYKYRTQSVLTIPMINHKNEVMACLQLVNAQDPVSKQIIPFSKEVQQIVQGLASLAAVSFDNKQLIDAQEALLESFIKVLAKAIDAKSPYTGAHCERVPALVEMLAAAGCQSSEGIFESFDLNGDEKYELHVAGWLHDCGKVSTPVHIMDKATKLETIFDRIELLRTRWEVLKQQARVRYLEKLAANGKDHEALNIAYQAEIAALEDDLAFLETANIGGEFMDDDKIERLKQIAVRRWTCNGKEQPLLSENELYNLSIRKGTITNEEREQMNHHMVHTCTMLEALPFPKHLQRVPEYACGHHERMDGKGYPKGIKAGEMSIPARMMAVADVFEALTAADRPYKPAKKLSEAMHIIGMMKKTNHLDPDIVDLFVKSRVYLTYAHKFMDASLIDEINEQAILDIQPEPMK